MSRKPKPVAHLNKDSELLHRFEGQHKYLLFASSEGSYLIHLIDQRVEDVDYIPFEEAFGIGTVLVGRIENILPQMNGAFLRISASGLKAFLPLSTLQDPHPNNRPSDGRLLAGDEVNVVIRKMPQKLKLTEVALIDGYDTHHALYEILEQPSPDPLRMIRQQLEQGILTPDTDAEIVTDSVHLYEQVKADADALNLPIRLYIDNMISLEKVYAIDTRLKELLSTKVLMKSGAFLYIEQTQAMCVIDVNSGKSMKKTDPESYYLQVNLEAATEIMHQLHVRNISGIVMIDFINMKEKGNIEALTTRIKELAKADPVKTRMIDYTKLGLIEMTRMKEDLPLAEKLKFWFDKSKE